MVSLPPLDPIRPPPLPIDPFVGLAVDAPLVLLPVRLETRWFPARDIDHLELRIRVFPDEIHVAAPAGATAIERADTAAYFRALASDGADAATTAALYARIVERAGASRAAWLVRALAPGAPAVPDAEADVAVHVAALPGRWIAIAKAPGVRVVAHGRPIAPDLAAAPSGDEPGDPGAPALGKALAWVTDFAAAEQAGMALRMTLARGDAAKLDELIVVGVRAGGPDAGGAALGELVARHASGDGAAFLPWGTPTNIAADRDAPHAMANRAPWSGAGARLFAPIGDAPAGDPARALAALGIAAGAARDVVADATDRGAIARAMHVALWPATWGYYLAELANLPADAIARARSLYLDHVRPQGPFPALRLRSQPYGLLPATSLARWPAQAAGDPLAGFVRRVAAEWQSATAHVPRLVGSTDVDRELVALLRRMPASRAAWVRQVVDAETAAVGFGGGLASWAQQLEAELARIGRAIEASQLGLPTAMRVIDLVYADAVARLGIPFVAPRTASRDAVLPLDYLGGIAAASPSDLAGHRVAGASPRTLLYLLARYAATRVRLERPPPMTGGTGTVTVAASPASAPIHATIVHAVSGTVWSRITGLGTAVLANPAVIAHGNALRTLAAAPVGELETALAGVLDSAAYRLDAWATALASERLAALRAAKPHASHVGGWAWLETPRPATRSPSGGFVHAPSLAQARTAAVLRAGYEAHRSDGPGATLAIDLSSARVRAARRLLDGMRDGRPIGRLLGDHLERWLVDHHHPELVRDARRASVPAGAPPPDLADGWALYHTWSTTAPTGVLASAFADLVTLVDAVADLLVADSVHHALAGSPARAGAALDALERGEISTPDPRVDRTATDGVRFQRRVVLMLPGSPGWPGAPRPRAVAAPGLESLAARVLGDPRAIHVRITVGTDAATQTVDRTLADLDLCALDAVALAADGTDRAFLELAAASVTLATGAVRQATATPALDELVLRAAALGRLLRAARTPLAGELGASITVGAPADRSAQIASAVASLARTPPRLAAAALLGTALAADRAGLAAAVAGFAAQLAAGISPAELVLGAFARPAPIGAPTSATPVAARAGELASWLSDVARVRSALEPLDLLALVAPAVFPAERRRTSDGVELVVFGPTLAAADALVIDGWSEAAPAETITTGVAFRYDAPRAQPPQVVLLAVPPPTAAWSLELVESMIDETIARAKLRMIAPEDVRGQLAPTLLIADDPDDLVPAVDLATVSATQMEAVR